MNPNVKKISFNIFAADDAEAQQGENAIKQFIKLMCENGAMVSGNKIAQAVDKLKNSPFVKSEIIKFFQKE